MFIWLQIRILPGVLADSVSRREDPSISPPHRLPETSIGGRRGGKRFRAVQSQAGS
jgi:hypothetical protein